MRAVAAASFSLLFLGISVFGHGVERGSIRSGFSSSDFGLLSETTKQEISQAVENRCDLSTLVSATAEFAGLDEPASAMAPNTFRIRIRAVLSNSRMPTIIIVRAFEASSDRSAMEYSVESPICR